MHTHNTHTQIFINNSLVDGQLGLFQVFAIKNKAATNMEFISFLTCNFVLNNKMKTTQMIITNLAAQNRTHLLLLVLWDRSRGGFNYFPLTGLKSKCGLAWPGLPWKNLISPSTR